MSQPISHGSDEEQKLYEEQVTHLRNLIEQFPPEEKDQIKACYDDIWSAKNRHGEEQFIISVSLIGAELALQSSKEQWGG